MVAWLIEPADDAQVATSVERGSGNHLLKQVGTHAAAAREGHQDAAGCQQFGGQQVEVFVGAAGPLDLSFCGRKLGRIQQDEVVATRPISKLAQFGKGIALDLFANLNLIEFGIAASANQR